MQKRHLPQISGPERELTVIISQTHSHKHLLLCLTSTDNSVQAEREKHYPNSTARFIVVGTILYLIRNGTWLKLSPYKRESLLCVCVCVCVVCVCVVLCVCVVCVWWCVCVVCCVCVCVLCVCVCGFMWFRGPQQICIMTLGIDRVLQLKVFYEEHAYIPVIQTY